MIESRSQAAKYLDLCYHSVRNLENKYGLTYPITEEALTAIRAAMRPYRRFDLRSYKYRNPANNKPRRARASFGRFIMSALNRRKRTRKWLAMELQVSEAAVGSWIRGMKYPRDPDKVRRVLGG